MIDENAKTAACLAREVLALCDMLAGRGVRACPCVGREGFKIIDLGDREPAETLYVSAEGAVVRRTCKHSHHNGDPYDDREELLEPQEALTQLLILSARLKQRVVEDEVRLIEARRVGQLHAEALAVVEQRLAAVGLPVLPVKSLRSAHRWVHMEGRWHDGAGVVACLCGIQAAGAWHRRADGGWQHGDVPACTAHCFLASCPEEPEPGRDLCAKHADWSVCDQCREGTPCACNYRL